MKKIITLLTAILISFIMYSQEETHGNRTHEYTIDVNKLKTHKQKLEIEKNLSKMEGVTQSNLDALNYQLHVTIYEPENAKHTTDIDDIKIILSNSGVEIKNYKQEVKIEKK